MEIQNVNSFAFLALGLLVIYVFLFWKYRWESLGTLFLPLALILLILALHGKGGESFTQGLPILKRLHIFFALLTMIFMVGSFILGIAFFIQERGLREKKWNILRLKLPPRVLSERSAYFLIRLGFVAMTIVLVTGSFLTEAFRLHIWFSFLAWGAYAVVLNRRWTSVEGKRILFLSGFAFFSLVMAYLWTF